MSTKSSMTARHEAGSMGMWFRMIAAAAFASLICVNVWQGRVFQVGRLQILLMLISLVCVVASMQRFRRSAAAAVNRSRHESPLILAKLNGRFRFWILYALWFAAVTSLGEMAYRTYTKEVTKYAVVGYEFMWRIPLGYALIFSVITCGCWVATRKYPRPGQALLVASFFVTVCGWLPIMIKGLDGRAILLLAAGIAVQLTRISGTHAYLLHRLVRGTVAAAVLLTLAMSAGFYGRPLIRERRELSRLPSASAPGPNVLLIVLDTVRAKSLSLYGYHRPTTPNLDRFALRGTVFNRAYSTSPWTLPSHGSMFTGRLPHELFTAHLSPLPPTYPTLSEGLAGHGYQTAGFVANTWMGGAAYGLSRGFLRYEDEPTTLMTSFMNTYFGRVALATSNAKDHFQTHDNFGRKSAEAVNRSFLAWLSKRETARPFFAFLNYCDAHGPYLPPEPFALKFSKTRPRGDVEAKKYDEWSPAEIRELNDAYDGAIAYLDHQLDRLFDALDHQGVLKDTIVIVTSDHGEQFAEHNLVKHVNSLYLPLLHVPLVIVYPGHAPAGGRIDEAVSLRSLPATIVELTGLGGPFAFPGKPLLSRGAAVGGPVGEGEIVLAEVERFTDGSVPEWYPARRGRMKSVLFRDWQYIRNFGDGKEELFDLRNDPETEHNLAGVELQRLREYRGHLESVLSASEKERIRAGRAENR